jgi:hypothetical protein
MKFVCAPNSFLCLFEDLLNVSPLITLISPLLVFAVVLAIVEMRE